MSGIKIRHFNGWKPSPENENIKILKSFIFHAVIQWPDSVGRKVADTQLTIKSVRPSNRDGTGLAGMKNALNLYIFKQTQRRRCPGERSVRLFCFRVRVASMAGYATDRGDRIAFVILIEAKIFFVDFSGHAHHVPGDILFGLFVAGKIGMMGSRILRGCVAEIAFYAESRLEFVHNLSQVFTADVFWQDLEISLRLVVEWLCGGHAYRHKCDQ